MTNLDDHARDAEALNPADTAFDKWLAGFAIELGVDPDIGRQAAISRHPSVFAAYGSEPLEPPADFLRYKAQRRGGLR